VVEDDALRQTLGVAARRRAARDFSPSHLTSSLIGLYATLVERAGHQTSTFDRTPVSAEARPAPGIARRSSAGRNTWYQIRGKRALDAVLAGLLLVGFLPVFAVLGAAVRAMLGTPVLFRQMRPGRSGMPFVLVKFRSMTDRYDSQGNRLPDEDRLTRFGRVLRASSLDELPELWNVLRGDMSLVGPRPLLLEYLPRYSERQAGRHAVRPGITGLAQISGRNALMWEERFELDLRYVEECSLWLDLKILARTAGQVILRRGISEPGHATSQEFVGAGGR
jgi:lipopolysaccharide/colanic/teichoic acid biosynthesis glycosyltransferase